MKKLILDFEIKSKDFKELVQEAFNKDILNFLVSKETINEFENIERVKIYSKNAQIPSKYIIYEYTEDLKEEIESKKISSDNIGVYVELKSKEDERKIVELSKTGNVDFIIVSAKDWKIIPFENLIAEMHSNETDLYAEVESIEEAELMLKTLEIGVDGILFKPQTANDLSDLKKLISTGITIELSKAKVLNIQNIAESERVCIDTTSLFHIGEGVLVGSTAMGFCLVHSETFETQFVASRPFRVNSGDVSAYVLIPDDDPDKKYRTKYLSELKGGDKVLAVTNKGDVRIVSIGRVKIETRPMLRFELEVLKNNRKIPISYISQNAETVRLMDEDGNAISVVDIKIGDNILVHIGPGSTHFGTPIKETIIEK